MTDENSTTCKPVAKLVRGFPIPTHPIFKPEYADEAMDYVPRANDVILLGYPKTGTSWQHSVIWCILNMGQQSVKKLGDLLLVESSGKQAIDALMEPRTYKYHLPVDRIRISDEAKYVYMYRNPADVVISYHHFRKAIMNCQDDLETFFDQFMSGQLPFGNFFDHVLSAFKHKDDENFLFLGYEDAKKDPLRTVLRIAEFIGGKYYQQFLDDSSLADKVVEQTSFDYMKENVTSKWAQQESSKGKENFFRKGVTGEGKSKLSVEQKTTLNEIIKRKMAGTEFIDKWLI